MIVHFAHPAHVVPTEQLAQAYAASVQQKLQQSGHVVEVQPAGKERLSVTVTRGDPQAIARALADEHRVTWVEAAPKIRLMARDPVFQ
jgi:hypothetical protein